MSPLERMEAYRQIAIEKHNFPPNSRLVTETDGTYLERIDKNNFCCGTTMAESRIKLI